MRPPGTTAWPAGSAQAVRWLIQGAWGTTWHAGKGPGAMHRLTTVALPPNGWAAGVSVSQACPFAQCGRR
jgi:hypothetical protein